jgi:hypothetical protein
VDIKDFVTKQGFKLMQDPRISKWMQDERVMKAVMQAMQLRGKVQQSFDEKVDRVAKALNLATKREIRELRRTLRKMEQEMEQQNRGDAKGSHGRSS